MYSPLAIPTTLRSFREASTGRLDATMPALAECIVDPKHLQGLALCLGNRQKAIGNRL